MINGLISFCVNFFFARDNMITLKWNTESIQYILTLFCTAVKCNIGVNDSGRSISHLYRYILCKHV